MSAHPCRDHNTEILHRSCALQQKILNRITSAATLRQHLDIFPASAAAVPSFSPGKCSTRCRWPAPAFDTAFARHWHQNALVIRRAACYQNKRFFIYSHQHPPWTSTHSTTSSHIPVLSGAGLLFSTPQLTQALLLQGSVPIHVFSPSLPHPI